MRSSSPVISAVVFGLAVFLVLLFGIGGGDSPADPGGGARAEPGVHAAAPTADSLDGLAPASSGVPELAAAAPTVVVREERESAQFVLAGWIVDEAGASIAAAELLWISLDEEGKELRTRTGADGRFHFEEAPIGLDEGASAVWVLHTSYYSEVVVLERGEEPALAFGSALRLEAAPEYQALVLAAGEFHAVDASVRQVLARGGEQIEGRGGADEGLTRALQLFEYTARADAQGEALLVPQRWDSTLVASLDVACSAPWSGESAGTVELRLQETFEVLGIVSGSSGTESIVRCEAVGFGNVTLLAEVPVSASGAWGPEALPLLDVAEYVFTLRGDVAARQVKFAREEITSQLVIDFDAVAGVAVDLLILGLDEAPLEGAKATVHWKQGGSWQGAGAISDEDGRARARGIPVGISYARVRCAGHVAQLIGPFEVDEGMDAVEVRLELAGQIIGRCLRAGEPVENFRILYWAVSPKQAAVENVSASEDGSFLIAEAPLGEVTLLGLDEEVSNGEPLRVVVVAGEPVEVTIELPRGLAARGRVVDAVTGDSISGARVQMMSAYDGDAIKEFGAESPSDAAGGFALEGLTGGVGALRVRADGYIEEKVITHGGVGEVVELGLIALQPSRELIVQLDGPPGMDYRGYRVILEDYKHLGVLNFDHTGSARFQDIPNGVIELSVFHPDDSITAFADSLRPQDEGRFLVPIAGGHRLVVEVLPEPGLELPEDLYVGVGGMLAGGGEISRWLLKEGEGRYSLDSVQAGPTVVRAVALSGVVYAMRRFDLPAGKDTQIEIELGDEDDFIIRVLDAESRPVPNARVNIYLPRGDPCFFVRILTTDSAGEARVHGFGFPHAQVTVTHETRGSGDVGLVDVAALQGEPLVVRLEAQASLDIGVHDDGDPVVAAAAVLRAVEPLVNGSGFGERTTSQDGGATWENLMPGEYELFVHGVGLWPTRRPIEVRADSHRQSLEVRRTGHLSLLLFGARGASIPGAVVELHCAELGASLSGFIAAGLLPGATTQTDATGRLTLPPLPRGAWTWSATAPDGRSGGGAFYLPAGEPLEIQGMVQ